MKVFLECFGCEQRQLDSEQILKTFISNNAVVTKNIYEADVAIVTTCGVTKKAIEQSISLMDSIFNKCNGSCRLVVSGCLPWILPSIKTRFSSTSFIRPGTLSGIRELLSSLLRGSGDSMNDDLRQESNTSRWDISVERSIFNTARQEYDCAKAGYKIVINHGCLSNCSYCAIRKATGQLVSVTEEKIYKQVKKAAISEESTIMLMGGDVGAYGKDKESSFVHLLKNIIEIQECPRLFLHDYNMKWFAQQLDELNAVTSINPDKVGAIMVPVQSGSSKILSMMNRNYDSKTAQESLVRFKNHNANIVIGTHIIVGFPGEGEDDFKETCCFLKNAPIDFISCFPYSNIEGTEASRLAQVPEEIILERLAVMQSMFSGKIKIFF